MTVNMAIGPLVRDVEDVPSTIERIAHTPNVELYRSQNRGLDKDPEYVMVTADNVLATFGETGLVQTIERIDGDKQRHLVVYQDGQGRYHIDPDELPVDGIQRDPRYTEGQHLLMALQYVYDRTKEIPAALDQRVQRFHALTAERAIARFQDYSTLLGPADIIPDYTHRTNIVTVSSGCRFACRFCPEGGEQLELYSPEKIRENMLMAREIQRRYHSGLERYMDEGFLNTADLLAFGIMPDSPIRPEDIIEMYLEVFPEAQKLGTFMDVRSILEFSKDQRFNGTITSNNLRGLRQRTEGDSKSGVIHPLLTRAYVGIETAHDEASKFLGKNIPYDDKFDALSLLQEAGFRVKAIIQVGALGEGFYRRREDIGKERTPKNFVSSREALARTVNLMQRVEPYRTMVSSFVPLQHLPLLADPRLVPYEDSSQVQDEIDFVVEQLRGTRTRVELSYEQFVVGKQRRPRRLAV
jgi:radical SAM superfamily enzyme YgiQ (UPF0313 family)